MSLIEKSLTEAERATVKHVARQSIEHGLEHHNISGSFGEISLNQKDYPESLQQQRATFVTLQINNNLRGCIGTLEAHQPLVIDVAHNAHAAAFSDPRFPPLSQREFKDIDIHISILSPAVPIQFESEAELLKQIRPHIDGLILEDGRHRGTFLPSVWESLSTAEEFLLHLKYKAGLPADYWSDTIKVSRYTTDSF